MAGLDLIAQDFQEVLVVPWFQNKVADAKLHSFDHEIDGAPGRHRHNRQGIVESSDARNQIETFAARRGVSRVVQIHENYVVLVLLNRFQCGVRRQDSFGLVALALEQQP